MALNTTTLMAEGGVPEPP